VDLAAPLQASSAPDVLAALGELVDENRESIRNSVAGLEQVMASLNGAEGTFGRLLNDEQTANSVVATIESAQGTFDNIEALTEELRGGQGTIGKLIYDEKLYNDIEEFVRGLDETVADARKLMADARDGEGVISTLIYDPAVAASTREIVESLRSSLEKVDRGDGTLARLINDPTIANDLEAALKGFNNPEGTVGRLLNEPEIYDNLLALSADAADAAAAIKEQRGTLGILINDDTIATDIERALRTLTGGLEEQREAAPIATFLSTVFLGF